MDNMPVSPPAYNPSVEDIQSALKAALDEALDAVKYDAGDYGGWAGAIMAAGNPKDIDISDEDALQRIVRQTLWQMNCLQPDDTDHNRTLACQLLHLFHIYFTEQPQLWRDCNLKVIVNVLAKMANRIEGNSLWPNGSWVSNFHKPNPSWLSEDEYSSVVGDLEYAIEYKRMLHRLGYSPVTALTKEALDSIWHDLYIKKPADIASGTFSAIPAAIVDVPSTSTLDKYAVVSYVQCANGTKPPASWTTEVDSVLDGLVQLGVIPEKLVWFDKLASRQYKDSLKWWGATATMQFLFNPVIVILPRMSEHPSFTPSIGTSIWGSGVAVDDMYADFLKHAHSCTDCQLSFALRWALQQDHVIPVGSLRTWPRVEHALGASGLGLFTSETTYSALVACLTCAFSMWGTLLKNDAALHRALVSDAMLLPSTYRRKDDSMLIGGWVVVSCCQWQYNLNQLVSMASLKDMASTLMELHSLFCQLQIPRLLALGRESEAASSGVLTYEMERLSEAPSLFYPKGKEVIDVPTLARFNSNDTYRLHGSHIDLEEDVVVGSNHHWALLDILKNQPQEDITTTSFVMARKRALSTLVYTKAAQAPCYDWSDKLVAAIILSLPNIFAEAVTFWNKSDWLRKLSSTVLSNAEIEDIDIGKDQGIEWEPNTLIVALTILSQNHILHRLVPRPPSIELSKDRPAFFQPFVADDSESKRFMALFLGHLPPWSLNALNFKTTANVALPRAKEWVHEILQDGALCNVNVVVIRSLQPAKESQDLTHCWHCSTRKAQCSRESWNGGDGGIVVDISTLQDFIDDMLGDYGGDQSKASSNLMWGLGSFDPLNLGALCDDDYHFGEQPDTVAVLLERGSQSVKNTAGWMLHAQGIAHFCILGTKATRKCEACHALIILEKDTDAGNSAMAVWTILPLLSYKDRFRQIPGFAEIV